jgi:hypothetical protein
MVTKHMVKSTQNTTISIVLYADKLTLLNETEDDLQRALNMT